MRRTSSISFLVAFAIASAVPGAPTAPTAATGAPFDLNCDGHRDLAVGVPGEGVKGEGVEEAAKAGIVQLFGGSPRGPLPHRTTVLLQPAAAGGPEAGDEFGHTTASGDFDADGCPDLVVGAPGETIGDATRAGAITVFYGSARGSLSRAESWDGSIPSAGVAPEAGARMGDALAVGDFDDDGIADLAVGAPMRTVGIHEGAGSVLVAYGSSGGLGFAEADGEGRLQIWNEDVDGIHDEAQSDGLLSDGGLYEQFGAALAVGDFNGDGRDDLGVGIPSEFVETSELYRQREVLPGTIRDAGAVAVIYGSKRSGLRAEGNQHIHQDSPGIKDRAEHRDIYDCEGCAGERGDRFALALATADFDRDGYADLAIGIPEEEVGTPDRDKFMAQGAVAVLYGSGGGIADRDQFWHQDASGVKGHVEVNEHFGAALATGYFDGDRYPDLAIGVPAEDVGSGTHEGMVHVLRGGTRGLTARNDQVFTQASPGIEGIDDSQDTFGNSLLSGDFGGSGRDDLVVGVPGEDFTRPRPGARVAERVYLPKLGALHVIFGTNAGLRSHGSIFLHQAVPGVPGEPEPNDEFGHVGGNSHRWTSEYHHQAP